MYQHTVPVDVLKACGHSVRQILTKHNRRQFREENDYARFRFCDDCEALIAHWLSEDNKTPPLNLKLCELTGTPKQVAWAQSLRAERMKRLLPAMASAQAHGGKMAAAVWKTIALICMQQRASWWIEKRERKIDIAFEAVPFENHLSRIFYKDSGSLFITAEKAKSYALQHVERVCPVEGKYTTVPVVRNFDQQQGVAVAP